MKLQSKGWSFEGKILSHNFHTLIIRIASPPLLPHGWETEPRNFEPVIPTQWMLKDYHWNSEAPRGNHPNQSKNRVVTTVCFLFFAGTLHHEFAPCAFQHIATGTGLFLHSEHLGNNDEKPFQMKFEDHFFNDMFSENTTYSRFLCGSRSNPWIATSQSNRDFWIKCPQLCQEPIPTSASKWSRSHQGFQPSMRWDGWAPQSWYLHHHSIPAWGQEC